MRRTTYFGEGRGGKGRGRDGRLARWFRAKDGTRDVRIGAEHGGTRLDRRLDRAHSADGVVLVATHVPLRRPTPTRCLTGRSVSMPAGHALGGSVHVRPRRICHASSCWAIPAVEYSFVSTASGVCWYGREGKAGGGSVQCTPPGHPSSSIRAIDHSRTGHRLGRTVSK